MKSVTKATYGGLPLLARRDDEKNLPLGGQWLSGCIEGTESYIHPTLGWRATRVKWSDKQKSNQVRR